ncbi:hypothetical protein [Herbaspirillum robiniae]|uniref:hypothetical protein n=1 Tax=Herbaspirillum robiniae TaxID=2014887 RepID=UPI003D779C2B
MKVDGWMLDSGEVWLDPIVPIALRDQPRIWGRILHGLAHRLAAARKRNRRRMRAAQCLRETSACATMKAM